MSRYLTMFTLLFGRKLIGITWLQSELLIRQILDWSYIQCLTELIWSCALQTFDQKLFVWRIYKKFLRIYSFRMNPKSFCLTSTYNLQGLEFKYVLDDVNQCKPGLIRRFTTPTYSLTLCHLWTPFLDIWLIYMAYIFVEKNLLNMLVVARKTQMSFVLTVILWRISK